MGYPGKWLLIFSESLTDFSPASIVLEMFSPVSKSLIKSLFSAVARRRLTSALIPRYYSSTILAAVRPSTKLTFRFYEKPVTLHFRRDPTTSFTALWSASTFRSLSTESVITRIPLYYSTLDDDVNPYLDIFRPPHFSILPVVLEYNILGRVSTTYVYFLSTFFLKQTSTEEWHAQRTLLAVHPWALPPICEKLTEQNPKSTPHSGYITLRQVTAVKRCHRPFFHFL